MQLKLPVAKVMYECLNDECFYCETLMTYEDVLWKDVWNSEIGDLDLLPLCPSCREFMAIWECDDGKVS